MGIINFSIPKDLVIKLSKKHKIVNFIETGTYKGGTCFWAANYFEKVYTIEIDEGISKETASKPDCPQNIEFLIGNSKNILPDLIPNITGSCFFWLDGHWCSGAGGKDEECPLLFELEAIKPIVNPLIFIDDARCFLGPLPSPHDSSHWPRIDEIFLKLNELFPGNRNTIHDDVIISVPKEFQDILDKDWTSKFNERFYSKQNLGIWMKLKAKIFKVIK